MSRYYRSQRRTHKRAATTSELEDVSTLKGSNNLPSFLGSILGKLDQYGTLSEKQWYWVRKIAAERRTTLAKPQWAEAPKYTETFSRIAGMFAYALDRGLKRPGMTFSSPIALRLKLATQRSKYAGDILVTAGGYNTPYYGRMTPEGKFFPSHACGDSVLAFLRAFDSEPAKLAAEHGHGTGACCFCRLPLTDPRSVGVGYGPICAEHYGLPWGNAKGRTYDRATESTPAPVGAVLEPAPEVEPDLSHLTPEERFERKLDGIVAKGANDLPPVQHQPIL